MDEQNLKQVFVGEKFDKVYNKKFSICALLFGSFYYIYRKMLRVGFAFFILELFVSCCFLILDKGTVFLSSILIRVSISLLFSMKYRNFVDKEVNKIKIRAKSIEEAEKLCKKRGRTSVAYVILFIVCSLIIGAVFLVDKAVSHVKDEFNIESFSESKVTISDEGYSGTMGISGASLEKYIKYELNEEFKEDEIMTGSFVYEDPKDEIFNEVTFFIGGYKNLEDNTTEKFVSQTEIINEKKWTILKYIADNSEEKMYAYSNVEDIVIIINYKIERDVEDKEKARKYFYDILNSIEYVK